MPLEHFGQLIGRPIKLQVVKEKEDVHVHAETLNSTTPSAVRQQELYETKNAESTTLSKKVSNANQKDDLYNSICAHLEDSTKHAKPEDVKLKGCRISKGLLMKRNQL